MIVRIDNKKPVVALESTVIAHGLPYPANLEVARKMEEVIRKEGAIPATIGILNGEIIVGMTEEEVKKLIEASPKKTGVREIPYIAGKKLSGDTTVSATVRIASMAGIDVFVTGGIGGFHRGVFDISQDLIELSRTGAIVVSAGAKSILDLQKTVELLETLGVVVVGFKTDEFPAFYTRESGIKLNMRVDSIEEIVSIYKEMKEMNYTSSLLVVNPVPEENEIAPGKLENWIKKAEKEAMERKISGKELTPFLLSKLAEYSGKETVKANIALLLNNAELGAKIAIELKE
ncbi:MAG: pseudouridine-5'-phosphate glycosidase [Thermotogaceae bacterium]|nr:pseudouridine-5'-phosphate glycosidase [Thermotogaceae bacterium]